MSWVYVAVAAAAVIGGISASNNNRAQQAQLDAQARANDFNAARLRQKADETATAFNLREEQKRRANRIEAGKRYAAAAQSGVGLEGSNLDYLQQQDVNAELDALNIRYEGQLERTGLLADASAQDYYAESARASRTNTRRNWIFETAGSALSSGMGAYGAMGGGSGRSTRGTTS